MSTYTPGQRVRMSPSAELYPLIGARTGTVVERCAGRIVVRLDEPYCFHRTLDLWEREIEAIEGDNHV